MTEENMAFQAIYLFVSLFVVRIHERDIANCNGNIFHGFGVFQ